MKLRLIHDLRRPRVNSRVSTQEWVILPRINDAGDNMLNLIDRCGAQRWEAFVLDFKDAFKQIKVHIDEHRYLAGTAIGGIFPFCA